MQRNSKDSFKGAGRRAAMRGIAGASLALAAAALGLAGPAHAQAPIKMGAVLSTSGPAAIMGDPALKTLQLGIERVNAQGGLLGRKIQLIPYDDGSDANKANTLSKRLIEDDQVDLIIGASLTGNTMAMIPNVEKSGVPTISLAAGIAIVEPVKKWVFKTPHTDRQVAERLFEDMKKRGLTKIGLLSDTSGFGQSGRKEMNAAAGKYGLTIVADETYGPKDTDMTPQLTKIRSAPGVQAVVIFGFGQAMATANKNYAQLDMKLPLYQSHAAATEEFVRLAGKSAEGVRMPAAAFLVADALPANDPQKPVALAYRKDFQERYKEEVAAFGGNAYDAFVLATEAIKRAGSTDKEKVRAALEQIKSQVGLNGVFSMTPTDHLGLDLFSLRMIEVKNGKFVLAN